MPKSSRPRVLSRQSPTWIRRFLGALARNGMRPSHAVSLMKSPLALRYWIDSIHIHLAKAHDGETSASDRRQEVAAAAALVRRWRVTPQTPIEDLDLTVRAFNTLARAKLMTVGAILRARGEEKPETGPLNSPEQRDSALREIGDRLIAGSISEAMLPTWLKF